MAVHGVNMPTKNNKAGSPSRLDKINEITIIDGHKILYSGSFKEFCNSDNDYLTNLRLSTRQIQEKVFYQDKLFCFLDRNDGDDTPIAHLVLGGNRDA